ncbi:unnamed protein product [Cochlearia groenlandica]
MSNKDEALRAKEFAEDFMRKSNFPTARRIAMKAQNMDPTLESVVARMIMVCDVHCAALEKSGDECDWYKILQVEPIADENTIKKQYRKLALHLHPDKNTLPGAECAFKTIGEAQRVLLDKDKRRLHDMKRNPLRRPVAPVVPSYRPQQAPHTRPVFLANFNATRNTGFRPANQQIPQAQPNGFSGVQRFWTLCAFCHRKCEYLSEFINKQVNCVSCGKQIFAFRSSVPGPSAPAPQFPFSKQSKVPTQEAAKAAEKQPINTARNYPRKQHKKAKSTATAAAPENGSGKRKRKMIVDSSDSSSSDCEEVETGREYSGSSSGQNSRRSVRRKQQVSYKENKSDGDNEEEEAAEIAEEPDIRKKSHENHLSAETLPNCVKKTEKVKEDQVVNSRDSVADPKFTNFDKFREERCFKAGQIWAMYDEVDTGQMPRFYAIIRKVTRKPSFMLKITWLEAEPDDEKAKQWLHKNLPVSVGKFVTGIDGNIKELAAFSHLIHCKAGSMKDTVSVYPRKGETWALFKNWDINWCSGRQRLSSQEHEYDFEFVEILSEYAEGDAIEVALLRKLKGFASVFCRAPSSGGSGTFQIPPREFLRFSHGIPSTKLTGEKGNGVPIGSYELDTDALPEKIEEVEAAPVSREAAKLNQVHRRSPPSSSEPDCIIIPRFDFHDFSAERSKGNIAKGQIWSLKSKEDGLPKYYAKIHGIQWTPEVKVQVNRLELESLPENVTQWRDKNMLISVGNFTLKEGRVAETLTNVADFSHMVKAQSRIRQNECTVLPKTGEIWAMYKNWSETIKATSLKKCEYEVVEVLDDNESHVEVMMLKRLDGFMSVYKAKVEGGMDVKKKVPRSELLRFSHYVPAFRLTGERDGALRGCVELDSTALSCNLRRS